MSKIALLIVYNHRYDRNIPIIDKIYLGKFSHIFHVIPFYDGSSPNVIPVYESSFQFSGYIAQAVSHIYKLGFTHYFVVADDMIINPTINEKNLFEKLGMAEDECFIKGLINLQKFDRYWRFSDALNYNPYPKGVEVKNILPSYEQAVDYLAKFGITHGPLKRALFKNAPTRDMRMKRYWGNTTPPYPVCGGYSDIFIFTEEVREKFCLYCGAFAATGLFVEMAIPTAMVFSANKIRFGNTINLQSKAMWSLEEIKEIEESYHKKLSELMNNYPSDTLFFHPIKLSQWNTQD